MGYLGAPYLFRNAVRESRARARLSSSYRVKIKVSAARTRQVFIGHPSHSSKERIELHDALGILLSCKNAHAYLGYKLYRILGRAPSNQVLDPLSNYIRKLSLFGCSESLLVIEKMFYVRQLVLNGV